MRHRRFFIAAFFSLALADARADTVYLKNGNKMEGKVTSESSAEVELDIGYGTVSLRRSDIRKIRRAARSEREAADGELRRREYESGRRVPKGAEKFAALFEEVRLRRDKALEAKALKQSLEEEAERLRSELADLKERYQSAATGLRDIDPAEDADAYNEQVVELNKTGVQIRTDGLRLEGIPEKEREADAELPLYLEAYRRLADYLRGPGATLVEGAPNGDAGARADAEYYAWMRGELRKMEGDFARETVVSEVRGGNVIVDAVLNGRVHARLMVDTGATMTVLYKSVSDRLDLESQKPVGVLRSTVADGRTLNSPAYRLDSISVGNSRVRDSVVAAMPSSVSGFDGLLGMSFLSHFVVQVDSANGRLILQRLK